MLPLTTFLEIDLPSPGWTSGSAPKGLLTRTYLAGSRSRAESKDADLQGKGLKGISLASAP